MQLYGRPEPPMLLMKIRSEASFLETRNLNSPSLDHGTRWGFINETFEGRTKASKRPKIYFGSHPLTVKCCPRILLRHIMMIQTQPTITMISLDMDTVGWGKLKQLSSVTTTEYIVQQCYGQRLCNHRGIWAQAACLPRFLTKPPEHNKLDTMITDDFLSIASIVLVAEMSENNCLSWFQVN